ncbi:MAG: PepSY-like domain-containing protein [Prevotella sp.]|nr:PepSY-like domain-containing protein [Prevotella sp.]
MKQTKIFLITILTLVMSAVCFADSNPIPADRLPHAAKSFIKKEFANAKIVYAERESDAYDCRLDNGIEIEFDLKGVWLKIDGSVRTALPASVIPHSINKYVKKNYPKLWITEIEKGRYGYKVEMSNKYNLKFTRQGTFIGKNH